MYIFQILDIDTTDCKKSSSKSKKGKSPKTSKNKNQLLRRNVKKEEEEGGDKEYFPEGIEISVNEYVVPVDRLVKKPT